MKILVLFIVAATFSFSIRTFAETIGNSPEIDKGIVYHYSNGKSECDISLGVYDVFEMGTKLVVVELNENKVALKGAILTQSISIADQEYRELKILNVSKPMIDSNKILRAKLFYTNEAVTSFEAIKLTTINGKEKPVSEIVICKNLKEIK